MGLRKASIVASITILLAGSAAFGSSSRRIWTDWYNHGLLVGGVQLIKMRNWLDRHALYDTNASLPKSFRCNPERHFARSADGSCNDLGEPAMGAAGTRFGRNVPLSAVRFSNDREIFSPNPREISRELLTRDEFKPIGSLNLFAATWIQFMVHDWLSHGENAHYEPLILPLAHGDPFGSEMMILRTQADSSRTELDRRIPLSFRNEVTHWWDGSQLYGSDSVTQDRIRSFKDGKLIIADDGLIPIGANGVEKTGFTRNWWVGIDLMHQIFTREHNAIAERLKAAYPSWGDQTLFDHARLINVAVMAKIHTLEWTPAILSNPILKQGMEANWYGFDSRGGRFPDLLKPLKDPVFNGIIGGKRDLSGVPYSITEEFTSVYRMHPLLPEALEIRSSADDRDLKRLPLEQSREEKAHEVLSSVPINDLLYSVGVQRPGALTLNNYPRFLQNLNVPIVGKMDLGTVELVRDRERGVPRYNEFRRQLNLRPILKFEDLTEDPIVLEKLHRLYHDDVEKLDLLIGTLAESHRPNGFGFGETQFQVFLLMASRRLQADRFFTTDFRPEVYTPEGMDWISKATFKSVLLRHFPALQKHLEHIDNAFRPWT
jgi:hypothetical protein